MNVKKYRPDGYVNNNDIIYEELTYTFNGIIPLLQNEFIYETLLLPENKITELSISIVEFAEDLYYDTGIWKCLEKRNMHLFKDPLPFIPKRASTSIKINRDRIQFFMWKFYQLINPGMSLSPNHIDLNFFANEISKVLNQLFTLLPSERSSSIKEYLQRSNKYGWDIKGKLIWLGKNSYLFRYNFNNYLRKHKNKATINETDYFFYRELTSWSGLGVFEVLKETAGLSESQKNDMEKWCEDHTAYYYVMFLNDDEMLAKNIINKKIYKIRLDNITKKFKKNQLISGSLVPWKKEWYWHGEQEIQDDFSNKDIDKARNFFIKNNGKRPYNYCPELLKKAETIKNKDYEGFKEYHNGKEFVIYQDGLTMAADEQKRHRLFFETKPKETIQKDIKEHDLSDQFPGMNFPKSILDCKNEVAVFFNKNKGIEYFKNINSVISGLKKNGNELNKEEKCVIRELILSDLISPQFVDALVKKYGHKSIAECFQIRNFPKTLYLKFLYHTYKESHFRTQYPNYPFTNI